MWRNHGFRIEIRGWSITSFRQGMRDNQSYGIGIHYLLCLSLYIPLHNRVYYQSDLHHPRSTPCYSPSSTGVPRFVGGKETKREASCNRKRKSTEGNTIMLQTWFVLLCVFFFRKHKKVFVPSKMVVRGHLRRKTW